jgi:predicted metal-dependent hydrolase
VPSFDLGARKIEYSVTEGTSRRYTYFHFRQDLTLEVILPRGRSVDVRRAILERSAWLRREYDRLSRTRNILTEDGVMYGGKHLRLVFSMGPGDKITPDEANGVAFVSTSDRRRVRELVRRWFLKESSAYTVRKVAELSPIVGARPSRVDVREISKWGYCTRKGRLSFSWQLIALPERLREYVVMHELTHLLEFNHSEAFRRKLAGVCPDFRAREEELDLIVPYDRLDLG